MNVEVIKDPNWKGTYIVRVDGTEWGVFQTRYHGPQGLSFVLRSERGYIVQDGEMRQHLRVYGDHLTERLVLKRPWHDPHLSIEERMALAARHAVEKGWLSDPEDVRAKEIEQKREREAAERRAKAMLRAGDIEAGMRIAQVFYPGGGEFRTQGDMARMIADAIEKGRSE